MFCSPTVKKFLSLSTEGEMPLVNTPLLTTISFTEKEDLQGQSHQLYVIQDYLELGSGLTFLS